jgi:hypothetical protein
MATIPRPHDEIETARLTAALLAMAIMDIRTCRNYGLALRHRIDVVS